MAINPVGNASASIQAKPAATPAAAKPLATPAGATPSGATPSTVKPAAVTPSGAGTPSGGTPVGGVPSGQPLLARPVQTEVSRNGPLLLSAVNNLDTKDTPFVGALKPSAVPASGVGTPVGVLENTPAGGVPAGATPAGAGLPIVGDDLNGTEKVNTALKQISTDPEGQKLLQAAQAKGYKILISDKVPNNNSVAITLTDENKLIIVNPNKQGFGGGDLVTTISHELVHAATDDNGDSLQEEALAETIGNRISKRVAGHPETAAEETKDFQKNYDAVKNIYKDNKAVDGRDDNGIFASVAALGIDTEPSKAGLPAIPALKIHQLTFDQFDSANDGKQDGFIGRSDIEKMLTGNGTNASLAKILNENFDAIAGADQLIDKYELYIVP